MTQLTTEEALPLRVITFNIRYATRTPVPGEQPWSIRCPKLCAQLNFITAGHVSVFICLQEVLYSQLSDIRTHLGPRWSYIGRGRDDGKTAGEFAPIFYLSHTWELLKDKTCWLSPTPEVPSRGWDAALNRVVTIGSFKHRETGARAIVMATHLDHRGEEAREQSGKLLLELARTWVGDGDTGEPTPLFLGGDFNSTPGDRAYKVITAPGAGMTDISGLVPKNSRYGNDYFTYSSFGEPGQLPSRIDFLFVRDPSGIKFVTFGVLSNRFDDGTYLSDHRAVVADMEIPVRS